MIETIVRIAPFYVGVSLIVASISYIFHKYDNEYADVYDFWVIFVIWPAIALLALTKPYDTLVNKIISVIKKRRAIK